MEISTINTLEDSLIEAEHSAAEEDEDMETNSEPDDALTKLRLPERDLFATVLKTQTYINGKQCTTPPMPNADDKWEMTFTYETYSPERARRLHQMSQDRRRKALDEEFREQALEGNETAKKAKEWNRGFLTHLKDLSQRGKVWREDFDKKWDNKDKVVWHEGTPPNRYGDMAWRDQQEQK
jgi:hypothetical protein